MHVIVLNCRPRSCVQDTNVRTARARNDRLAMDKIETRVSLESCCRVHKYALQSGFARPPSPRVLFDYWRRNMKLQWKLPIVGVALAAFAACNQNAPVSPSGQLGSNLAGSQSGDQDRGATGQPVDKGNGTPRDAKLVFSFNLIGTPKDYEGGCGSGRRVFVERGTSATILFRDPDRFPGTPSGWHIEECD